MNDSVSRWSVATVAGIQRPSEHACVLRLHVPGWSGNLAGQHVDVRLTAEDGYQATRSYSLADSGPSETIELAIDALPDGEVSPYLVSDVAVGDRLEVRGPIGAYFVWTPALSDPVQLIAGGSGIVPLAAIARSHAAAGSTSEMRLLYSARSRADTFYADELDALRDESFSLEWVYTRRAPADDPRPVGRVDAAILAAATLPAERSPLVYVCGPTRFVEAVSDLLVAQGHAPERVRTERFGGA